MKEKFKRLLKVSFFGLYEKYRNIKLVEKRIRTQKIFIQEYLSKNKVIKLQIGCGSNILGGWLNTDLNYSDNVAFLDAGKIFPFKSDSIDFIFSEHVFEHLNIEQQNNMIEESFRVLKNGGVLRIATPSLDFLVDLYSNHSSAENIEYVHWAVKNIPLLKIVETSIIHKEEHYVYVINNFFKAWGHQMIHNYSSLRKLVLQFNFSETRECAVGRSEFEILRNIEKHGTIIPEVYNLKETMVLEIVK